MATRPVKLSCCGRGAPRSSPQDFCSLLRISTGATIIEAGGQWSININTDGSQRDLAAALQTHQCGNKSAGVKLAQVVLYALQRAVAAGKQDQLKTKVGRQMPLVLMKDFLFKTVGVCSSCRGRGCTACHKMGVA